MVASETASHVCELSVQLSIGFTLVGVGLLYLAIAVADASIETRIVWASGLSLAVGFALVWTMARDALRTMEEGQRRNRPV